MQIDLRGDKFPKGERYEDQYGDWLRLFETIARTPRDETVEIEGCPWSWYPLLRYLNCIILSSQYKFKHCRIVEGATNTGITHLDRTAIEVLCGFRPECVDALWKCDMQWKTERPRLFAEGEFIVTSNGSFTRPEVRTYLHDLAEYRPTKNKVVLVPCAADKPYPAPLHKAVLAMLPKDYYLACVTGVLGIVPMDLWPVMPHYDSGIPNEWRCMNIMRDYFNRHMHQRIVSYCDFYNLAIMEALSIVDDVSIEFVNETKFYYDYIDLLDAKRLAKLKKALV